MTVTISNTIYDWKLLVNSNFLLKYMVLVETPLITYILTFFHFCPNKS